ncbi:STAM-binding protein-like [Mytilus californianus]|uniref:STAM-binding protein-like n=1 Tax=Mytilus californianus TaxID=6549 RepID=UPI002246A59E|nr:STAM-binding protein-like [Mytilus californianus]XP_052068485.1 STAM-binding protein-like [Mytilus californianus]
MASPGIFSEIHDPSERVRQLCTYACKVDIDEAIPPKRYLRSGLEMMRMAKVYQEEGNYESAFILYTKFISLFVEKLPKHPDFKSAPQADVSAIKKKVVASFASAEKLKAKLKERYAAIEKKRQEEEKRIQEELARKQAEEEARRKEIEELEECKRQEAETKWLEEQEARLQELKRQEQERQRQQEAATAAAAAAAAGIYSGAPPNLLNNQIPSAPPGNLSYIPNDFGGSNKLVDIDSQPAGAGPIIPDRDLKKNLVINDGPSVISPLPSVDRTTKPPAYDHFMSTGSSSGNKFGLRDVLIPSDLPRKFLVKAEHNTLKNVETCAFLAGKLRQDAFMITHLILPKQTGTADTCVAEDEEDLFLYQEPRDLITLGWIHTHPSQTAFLSSVDMHNQYGYQAMLPEAIAIVCSPKFNETGIFSLSIERGLVEIGSCRQKGFHQHTKNPPLFEDSSHARIVDTEKIEVADLR